MCGCAGREMGSDWQCSDSACCQVAGGTPHDALQVTHSHQYKLKLLIKCFYYKRTLLFALHACTLALNHLAICQRCAKHMVFCFMHTVTLPAATWLGKHLMTLYRYHIAMLMQVHCLLTTYCIFAALAMVVK